MMKPFIYMVIGLISMVVFGQHTEESTLQSKTIYKSIDFKNPQSIFFEIKGDISQIENFVTLSSQLKNVFKEMGILVHTDLDFSDSETKVVDKDIMVVNLTGLDRNTFETEMLLDFTSLKTENKLHYELKSKENEILLQGYFEFLENGITQEIALSISKRILALFD
ncbi:hypothetical protein [Flagellimonas beolgyonensis]|uniref:hypothetical protein n=1 Tax=Flagellimonas beolgyonensis TaxID=864064 RepID=UPI003D6540D7